MRKILFITVLFPAILWLLLRRLWMFDVMQTVWGVSGFSFFVMLIAFAFSFFVFTVRKFQPKKAALFSVEAAVIAEPFAGFVHFLVTKNAPDGEGSDFFLVYFSTLVICLIYLQKELPWAERTFRLKSR